jgi:hypothetical protein
MHSDVVPDGRVSSRAARATVWQVGVAPLDYRKWHIGHQEMATLSETNSTYQNLVQFPNTARC